MRIAIYSRKSKWTGRGESVENQVTMCREYIMQTIEGADRAEIIVYEDEGFSGKNTKRPQFQNMMKDMKQVHYDYLVCYKLDRLGRNLADLALLIEELNKKETSFISIKERFDTSTPIGKAMLYFSGVLAQMEREQIAERVRDNMILLARSGRWLGGNTPLGFQVVEEERFSVNGRNKKAFRLHVDREEIRTVKFIFQEYLEKQSLVKVREYFLKNDILTKRGKEYSIMAIRDILTNPVYCTADREAYEYFVNLGCQVCMDAAEADGRYGLMSYAKTSSAKYKSQDNKLEKWIISIGKHKGIVLGKDFVKVQELLEMNKHKGDAYRKVQNQTALLSGILYCSCGHTMRPKYYSSKQVIESGERKFSYLCPYKDQTHGEKCQIPNVQGNILDEFVCQEILRYTEGDSNIYQVLRKVKERMENSEEEKVSEADLIRKELKDKKQEVKNLISVLAKSGGDVLFIGQLREEIAKLNGRCEELEKVLKDAGQEGYDRAGDREQLLFLVEQMSSFQKMFSTLSVIEKREYLRIILDKVVWDGENAHIFVCGSQ